MLILDRNSLRVLFDKIASVYILFEKYVCILALEMVPVVSAHFRSLYKGAYGELRRAGSVNKHWRSSGVVHPADDWRDIAASLLIVSTTSARDVVCLSAERVVRVQLPKIRGARGVNWPPTLDVGSTPLRYITLVLVLLRNYNINCPVAYCRQT